MNSLSFFILAIICKCSDIQKVHTFQKEMTVIWLSKSLSKEQDLSV